RISRAVFVGALMRSRACLSRIRQDAGVGVPTSWTATARFGDHRGAMLSRAAQDGLWRECYPSEPELEVPRVHTRDVRGEDGGRQGRGDDVARTGRRVRRRDGMLRRARLVHAAVTTTIRRAYLLGAIGAVALGSIWMVYNASVIPAYGDTIDYLDRARTLRVDQYRTILYPAFLRGASVVPHGDGAPSTALVYAIQWGAMAAATGLFAAGLARGLGVFRAGRGTGAALIVATVALVATNPLVAHFALSLMSDSL